jgi:hypothetical protein
VFAVEISDYYYRVEFGKYLVQVGPNDWCSWWEVCGDE